MKQENNTNRVTNSEKADYKNLFFDNQAVWLNTKEAAQYLRISEQNLRVKVSRGEVPINGKLGRTLRFRREALDELMEAPTKQETPND